MIAVARGTGSVLCQWVKWSENILMALRTCPDLEPPLLARMGVGSCDLSNALGIILGLLTEHTQTQPLPRIPTNTFRTRESEKTIRQPLLSGPQNCHSHLSQPRLFRADLGRNSIDFGLEKPGRLSLLKPGYLYRSHALMHEIDKPLG